MEGIADCRYLCCNFVNLCIVNLIAITFPSLHVMAFAIQRKFSTLKLFFANFKHRMSLLSESLLIPSSDKVSESFHSSYNNNNNNNDKNNVYFQKWWGHYNKTPLFTHSWNISGNEVMNQLRKMQRLFSPFRQANNASIEWSNFDIKWLRKIIMLKMHTLPRKKEKLPKFVHIHTNDFASRTVYVDFRKVTLK